MAELKLDEMLKIIRKEDSCRRDTFSRVNGSLPSEKDWYTNDDTGKMRFFEDLKDIPSNPKEVTQQPQGANPVAMPKTYHGYSNSTFAEFSAQQRKDLLAELELPHYQQRKILELAESQKKQEKERNSIQYRQSFRFWRNIAIPAIAASSLALFGQSEIPSVSIDEAFAQHEVRRHEIDVQDYKRTHEDKSPPWQKSPEMIRMDNTKKYTVEKFLLYNGGILGLLGGVASGIASLIYLGLSKRK